MKPPRDGFVAALFGTSIGGLVILFFLLNGSLKVRSFHAEPAVMAPVKRWVPPVERIELITGDVHPLVTRRFDRAGNMRVTVEVEIDGQAWGCDDLMPRSLDITTPQTWSPDQTLRIPSGPHKEPKSKVRPEESVPLTLDSNDIKRSYLCCCACRCREEPMSSVPLPRDWGSDHMIRNQIPWKASPELPVIDCYESPHYASPWGFITFESEWTPDGTAQVLKSIQIKVGASQ